MTDHRTTAERFVTGRRAARGFDAFPGPFPRDLEEAYAIQAAAIALWPDRIVGWKAGRLSSDLAAACGIDRFLGPVLARGVAHAVPGTPAPFPVIPGGFGAFEAEIVVRMARDADPARTAWGAEDARAMVGAMHIGVEVAGSPLATIMALGSLANVAGFGNALGLIVGPEIAGGRPSDTQLACTTTIDGVEAGRGSADGLPGGLDAGVAFALGQAARLGRPLTAGQWLSTGAITGVHPVRIGQRCTADFGPLGRIDCETVALVPETA